MSEPGPVPPSVRAQLLATEHWSLLATRSQTWSEVMSRIMGQFTFTSAVLVVLALVVQNDGPFRPLALGLGGAVLLTGSMTSMRVVNASHEDLQLVRGMNRLRAAYIGIDPGVATYLVSGYTDDDAGIARTYSMGKGNDLAQVFASAATFMVAVTSLVAGGWSAILLQPAGTTLATVVGIAVGLIYFAAFLYAGYRKYVGTDLSWPSPPGPSASGDPRP